MLKGSFPIEKFDGLRTPFYYYDLGLLRRTLATVGECASPSPEFRVHYAVKANANPVLLAEIAASGLGADCVSGGEIRAALEAGFRPGSIVYAGVGKSDAEINFALENGIINPDIGAHTHSNITTGLAENKFGINYEQMEDVLRLALGLPAVEYKGLHFHIGSQLLDMMDFVALCNRINSLVDELSKAGLPVGDINVGGGLGISYEHPNLLPVPDFKSYFDTFRRHLRLPAGTQVHFELGRSIVAQCGSLIARVLYVKQGTTKQFAIIDGSMTELIRPALYKAYHRIENLSSDDPEEVYDVVGPVCESSDVFLKAAHLNKCRRGDLLAIRSAGAYGEAMASRYNCRPLPETFFEK